MKHRLSFAACLLLTTLTPMHSMAGEGGGGFCLFELPADEMGKRRFINLTIVQFVDVSKEEIKIVYGGGSLGSGYEAKLAPKSPEEGRALLERMRKTAADCR